MSQLDLVYKAFVPLADRLHQFETQNIAFAYSWIIDQSKQDFYRKAYRSVMEDIGKSLSQYEPKSVWQVSTLFVKRIEKIISNFSVSNYVNSDEDMEDPLSPEELKTFQYLGKEELDFYVDFLSQLIATKEGIDLPKTIIEIDLKKKDVASQFKTVEFVQKLSNAEIGLLYFLLVEESIIPRYTTPTQEALLPYMFGLSTGVRSHTKPDSLKNKKAVNGVKSLLTRLIKKLDNTSS